MWGPTGLGRLFNASFGGQVSWLLPAALILLVAGLGLTLTRARTDRTRAAFLLWGGSLVVTALVFSLAAGIIHPYYTVALAPAIGALVGMGSVLLWRQRSRTWARLVLAAAVGGTSVWSALLLERSPEFASGLGAAVAIVGIGAAIAIVGMPLLHRAAVAAVVAVGLAGGVRRTDRVHHRHHADDSLRRHPVGRSGGHGLSLRRWSRRFPGRLRRRGAGVDSPAASEEVASGAGGGIGAGRLRRRWSSGLGGGGSFLNASTPGAALVTAARDQRRPVHLGWCHYRR